MQTSECKKHGWWTVACAHNADPDYAILLMRMDDDYWVQYDTPGGWTTRISNNMMEDEGRVAFSENVEKMKAGELSMPPLPMVS